ncbi:hypothetical protein JCM10908_003663 [Rhodotorula pacifica]|uniref:uncharacterized protein n=1 Tax=Rhodotorula pacifica TaxID=1495444 RepID=UPI00317CF1E2
MADLVIYALGCAVSNTLERVRQFRSPLIPQWDSPPLTTAGLVAVLLDGDSGSVLTEHGLNVVHESWQIRHAALWLRLRALRDARQKGLIGCWAGMCTPATLQATKEAAEEAQWVEKHLADAVEWCQGRKVAKLPLGKMVKARRGASKRAGADIRPTYLETPPSLLDLPFPLPLAPQSSRLALIVPRPPSLHFNESQAEEEERLRPPLYTEEADLGVGESTLEGGMWHDPNESRAYEAAVYEDDDVLAMLQRHYPEDYAHHPRTS